MKKKTLKKLITFAVLILILGGLIAGACTLKKLNSEEEEAEEDTSFEIFNKGSSIVTAISFKTDDTEMAFTYVNDDWVYNADRNFPLDQDSVASMAAAVGTVSAQLKVDEVSEDLSEYGLDPASLTVVASFSDGSEKTFLFGDTNSFNDCQYLAVSDDENVYMVASDVATAFGVDLDYLYEPESYVLQADSVTASDVSAVTITTAGGQSKEITDETGISELYDLIYTLDLADYEDYYADSNEMAYDYGISTDGERLTVNYTVESEQDDGTTKKLPKEYTVYIGYKYENVEEETDDTADTSSDTTAEEESSTHSYFYSFNGSTVVYTADGETVDKIFEYLAYEPATEETTAAE